MPKRRDLEPVMLPELLWDPEHSESSFTAVYQHVTDEANATISWYLQAKRSKKRGAAWLRVWAIVLVGWMEACPCWYRYSLRMGSPSFNPCGLLCPWRAHSWVEGVIDGKRKHAEMLVSVPAGDTGNAELTQS